MLEITNQLYCEAYKIWKEHNVDEYRICWDRRFHSLETIKNRDCAAKQLEKAVTEIGLQNISCSRPLENLFSLEPDCSCFNKVFEELRGAVDNGEILLMGTDELNGTSYYVGKTSEYDEEDCPSPCLIYETSYITNRDTDYLHDRLVIYGAGPDEEPLDGYFKMLICGDSERIQSEQTMSDAATVIYCMLHAYISNNE